MTLSNQFVGASMAVSALDIVSYFGGLENQQVALGCGMAVGLWLAGLWANIVAPDV